MEFWFFGAIHILIWARNHQAPKIIGWYRQYRSQVLGLIQPNAIDLEWEEASVATGTKLRHIELKSRVLNYIAEQHFGMQAEPIHILQQLIIEHCKTMLWHGSKHRFSAGPVTNMPTPWRVSNGIPCVTLPAFAGSSASQPRGAWRCRGAWHGWGPWKIWKGVIIFKLRSADLPLDSTCSFLSHQ